MFTKKGDKTLNMIFGMFVLVIISVVILSIFFRVAKSPDDLIDTTQPYLLEAEKGLAFSQCESLCLQADSVDTAIEFCRKLFKIDWNGNGIVKGDLTTSTRGRWSFCEDKIPCFLLHDCSEKGYGYEQCKSLLENNDIRFWSDNSPLDFEDKGLCSDPIPPKWN